MLSLAGVGMTRVLHILVALLACSAYATASACKDGTLETVKGTRCRRYAECENGSWHLKECKFGEIFDPTTLRCASAMEVTRCNDVSKCSQGRAYSHLGSSSLYYRCINGRISIQVCGAGEVFDPDLQYCRVSDTLHQEGTKRAKKSAGCEEGSRRRDGNSCKGYLECVNGEEVKRTCTDCMNFDEKTERCRFVFITPCQEGPTTPGSTTPDVTSPEPETKTKTPTTSPTTETTPATSPSTENTPATSPTTETTPETSPTTETTPPTSPTTETTHTTSPTTETTHTTSPITETTHTTYPTTGTTHTTSPTTEITTVTPCKEGDKIGLVDPECKAYEECKNGTWVKDSCGWWRKFDTVKNECRYTWFSITCAT